MKKIRIGILGAARIAPKGIIEPAQRRDDVEVTCVAARDPARARAFAAEHAIPSVAASYDELVTRDDVDLVYNALPSTGHAAWSIRALEAGKAVLCEKPFAVTTAQARQMVDAALRHGRPLIEAFHYRFHVALLRLFELANTSVGRITRAEAHFDASIPYSPDELRWRPDQNGGALMDLGCYTMHVLRTTFGAEPEIIAASAAYEHGVDAWTRAELRFPGDVPAQISCSMTAPYAAPVIVYGERGTLRLDNFVIPQRGCRLILEQDGVVTDKSVQGPGSYDAQLEHVLLVLAGAAPPLTGGADALANLTALETIRSMALAN